MEEHICQNCIYIGDKVPSFFVRIQDYICNSTENALLNYITGKIQYSTCLEKNRFGECPYFTTTLPDIPDTPGPEEAKPSIAISLSPSETIYDIETSLESITITAKVTKGSSEVKEVNFYVAGEIVNTITTEVASGGTFSYTYTPETPINSNTMFKVTATDVKDAVASSSQGITFIGASYYGIVNADTVTPTESEIKALDKVLKSSRKFLYQDITTDWGKVCYAYPASLGLLTNIKDNKNNFNYTDSFTYSSGKVNNIDYHIYTLTEPTAAENVELSFE